jgi:site-specific recombinase XerD
MQQAINDWLIAYPTGTRTGYRRDINNFTTWLGTDPLNATRADIQRYLAHLLDDQGLQPSTVRRKASAISSFYDYCVQEKIIPHSPAAHARRPRGDSAPKSGLPADQARALIATAKDHSKTAHALVWLMAGAGLRITEACTANIEDIHDDQLTVTVKGGHRQIKPLAPPVLAAVQAAIGDRDHGPVITNRDGDRLTRQRAWELVTRLTTSASVEHCTPHTLRHTAAK